jgi:thiol-disulfide isomerase/thioredoxin
VTPDNAHDRGAPLIDDLSGIEERPQNRREWSGVLRSLVLPALVVATIVGGLFYLERSRGGEGGAEDGFGTVALPADRNPTGRSPAPEEGRAAPDFLLRRPDGTTLRLSDLQGSPVLVNFWASWCAPCRKEMPEIVRAYDRHRDDGLVVVAVNLQENAATVQEFAGEFGMDFEIAIDRTGGVGETWRIGGPVKGIPSSYFLDERGVVAARVFGELTPDTLVEHLATIGVGD